MTKCRVVDENTIVLEKTVNLSIIKDDKFVEKFVNNDMTNLKKDLKLDNVVMSTGEDADFIFTRVIQTPVDIGNAIAGLTNDVWKFIRTVCEMETHDTSNEQESLFDELSKMLNDTEECIVIIVKKEDK